MKGKLLMGLLALALLPSCGFEVVDTGNRGIETRFGEVVGEPLHEGLHFYNPFTSNIIEFGVRQQKYSDVTSIFTKDTQAVTVTFALLYNVDPKFVTTVFKDYGSEHDVEEKIIKNITLGVMKDTIGLVIADELISKREAITNEAKLKIREALLLHHVVGGDLQFTNLDFDDNYEKAVEEKVVAIQNAQKARNQTVQVEEQAKQTVMTAKAAAEAMRIKSQALAQNKGLVEFEAVQRWDGKLPQYMFGGGTTPFIDMRSLGK